MNDSVVICNSLSKRYGDLTALSAVDLEMRAGEIFGLIGPDGAGKTTLFRILASLILPDDGSASVMGHDVVTDYRFIRRSIGFMPGRFSLYQDLSVEENLLFYASVFGVNIRDNYHLIRDIYEPLKPFRNRRAGKLSGGMKQKLALSCALIHKPDLIILDEPTTGVDAVSRKEFWDHLSVLSRDGMTILVSTPYMDEAQRCDRLAMIHKGTVLDIGTPAEIRSRFRGDLYQVACSNRYEALMICRNSGFLHSVHAFGQVLHISGDSDGIRKVGELLRTGGITDAVIERTEPTIEDRFMEYLV